MTMRADARLARMTKRSDDGDKLRSEIAARQIRESRLHRARRRVRAPASHREQDDGAAADGD
jgi:hypothetical protein